MGLEDNISKRQYNDLIAKIEYEGFDYCFTDYDDWKNIKDDEFHKLRIAYIEARSKLMEYIGE